jgi:hypothetical protein
MLAQRKVRKLVRNPGLFFRDFLLKRYPVANDDVIFTTPGEFAFPSSPTLDLDHVLRAIDLQLTAAVSTRRDIVDVNVLDLPRLASVLQFAAARLPAQIYLLPAGSAPLNVTRRKPQDLLSLLSRSSPVELLVTGADGRPMLRRRMICWAPRGGWLEALGQPVPLKRVRVSDGAVTSPRRISTDMTETSPIDAVYTWVNAADPHWQEMLSGYKELSDLDPDRFHQTDELRYSIRALDIFAPWIRNVYVLSNCSPPSWFVASDRYRWVWHDEVTSKEFLPTFNSHAIETMLHHVPDISEKFIYMNDDFFLVGAVDPGDFFSQTGRSRCRLEPYGTVLYLEQLAMASAAEEWQSAAVNSARIIQRDFGFFPTRMHQHVPYALDKSVYMDIESRYPDDIRRVRGNRFRQHDDISFTSFFYHHFAIATGAADEKEEQSFIVRPSNAKKFKTLLSKRSGYRFFCVNDGGGSSRDPAYGAFKEAFLRDLYPVPSGAERPGVE